MEAVLAPAGAVTALLVYFGWTRSRAFFGYFGIDQSILQYSLSDHLLRSADSTFGTAVLLLVVVLVLVALERAVATWTHPSRSDRIGRWARTAVTIIGLLLFSLGLLFALRLEFGGITIPAIVGAVTLAAGAIIVLRTGLALITLTSTPRAFARVLVLVPLFLASFWASTLYAQDGGVTLARAVDDVPARLPLVTVYSDKYLDLPGSAVMGTAVPSADETTRYRYTGLRLLAYSNGRWFLLTGRYGTGYRSSVLVLGDADYIRVEVARQQ